MHMKRGRDSLGKWASELSDRMHSNKATVALANKLTRGVWVVLTKPGATYERRDPRFA